MSVRVPPHLAPQGDAHQPLEGRVCIFQTEGHADVAEYATGSHERRILYVLLGHLNLVVTRECVQKAEEVTPCGGVHYLVDSQERVRILKAGLVEVCEVNAASLPPGVLGYDDGVGEPAGVDDLVDDSCLE